MDVRVMGRAMKMLGQLEDTGVFDGPLKINSLKSDYFVHEPSRVWRATFYLECEDNQSLDKLKALESTLRALLVKESAKKK